MRGAKQFMTFAGGTPFQHAAAAALAIAEEHGARLAAELAAKRDRLCDGLERAGAEVLRPAGTYFVNADVRPLGYDDGVEFCRELPERAGVVAIPTSVFCARPQRVRSLVRFAFCKREAVIDEAARAIGTAAFRLSTAEVVSALFHKVMDGMEEHDLLTSASAIAFQVLTSLIPLALVVLSVAGLVHLESAWTRDLAPQFQAEVSKEVYAVADEVVRRTLGQEQLWWLTLGLVFTVWQVSGVARAIMGVLSEIYNDGDDRSFRRRYTTSIVLGMSVTVLVLLAFAVARFGRQVLGLDDPGLLVDAIVFVLRWGAAFALLSTAVWLLLRFAPAHPGPHRWISFGSLLCVLAWIGTSVVFGLYVTQVADYNSIFGSLATVFVMLSYLYVSAVSFLIGAEVDAIVRAEWRT